MKKVLNTIKTILVSILVVISVCMMIFTIVSVTTFDRTDRDIFGYSAYIVLTDSMSLSPMNADDEIHFDAGDLIITKYVDPATLQEGDVITFISQNAESFGEVLTHRIRTITTTPEGEPGFITYGTNTGADDATVVTYPYVLGKYHTQLNSMGTFFQFLKTPKGYIVCIFVPAMFLIIYQAFNCVRLFRKYKKEQAELLEQERAQLHAERLQNAQMMQELQAMKQQLAQPSQAPPIVMQQPQQPRYAAPAAPQYTGQPQYTAPAAPQYYAAAPQDEPINITLTYETPEQVELERLRRELAEANAKLQQQSHSPSPGGRGTTEGGG